MCTTIKELALSFNALKGCPVLEPSDPWEPKKLDAWALSAEASPGALCAASFVLTVWNQYEPWRCGRFPLLDAMFFWSYEDRQVFLRWVERPWWM